MFGISSELGEAMWAFNGGIKLMTEIKNGFYLFQEIKHKSL